MPFSADMVSKLLNRTKTETRRVMKIQPPSAVDCRVIRERGKIVATWPGESEFDYYDCHFPYGVPGDCVGVREAVWIRPENIPGHLWRQGADTWPKYIHSATMDDDYLELVRRHKWRHRSSRFAPTESSRITLRIMTVRCERLQEIDRISARREGFGLGATVISEKYGCHLSAGQLAFAEYWNKLNKRRGFSWESNPRVWACRFSVFLKGKP